MQRFDRKRLQIDGLFKSRRGSPPRVPASRCATFIATNAAQMQLQKLQTQLKSPPNAAQGAAQRSSNRCQTQLKSPPDAASKSLQMQLRHSFQRCQRSFQIAINATQIQLLMLPTQLPIAASELPDVAFELPDTAFERRIYARMQDLRLTRSNTS